MGGNGRRDLRTVAGDAAELLTELRVRPDSFAGGALEVRTPISGEVIGHVNIHRAAQVEEAIHRAHTAFLEWRNVPAPQRGNLVRVFADELRGAKPALGRLVTIESGKILSEGLGEVQEMIDICTYAAGLSRQLCGLTIATERSNHRMMETWHPLGITGVISAFNFPVAVWAWNAALAFACGNSVVWKPSEKTPLCALAVQALFERAARQIDCVPEGLSSVVIGEREAGQALVDDPRVPLISATGSTAMGREVGPAACRPVRARASRARRQQCRHRVPVGGSGSDAAWNRICRDGHRGPALHYAEAIDCSRGCL